jgi:hypothetical protein
MFDLIKELFSSPNFGDTKVVSNFFRNESDDISNSLISNGLDYAFSVS